MLDVVHGLPRTPSSTLVDQDVEVLHRLGQLQQEFGVARQVMRLLDIGARERVNRIARFPEEMTTNSVTSPTVRRIIWQPRLPGIVLNGDRPASRQRVYSSVRAAAVRPRQTRAIMFIAHPPSQQPRRIASVKCGMSSGGPEEIRLSSTTTGSCSRK